jgi:hypothetical protein
MTTAEFSAELDVIYENINKNGAPGLDLYEKSMILTHAQELYVQNIASQTDTVPLLAQLYDTYTDNVPVSNAGYSWGILFKLPTNGIIKVLNEVITDTSTNIDYTVITLSNIEFQQKQISPYKYPPRRRAWRLLVTPSTESNIEVFCRPEVTTSSIVYKLRYVRKPNPIILTNLASLTPAASIDGQTAARTSELDIACHRDILKLAATLAEQYYYDKYETDGNK